MSVPIRSVVGLSLGLVLSLGAAASSARSRIEVQVLGPSPTQPGLVRLHLTPVIDTLGSCIETTRFYCGAPGSALVVVSPCPPGSSCDRNQGSSSSYTLPANAAFTVSPLQFDVDPRVETTVSGFFEIDLFDWENGPYGGCSYLVCAMGGDFPPVTIARSVPVPWENWGAVKSVYR